MLSSTPDSDNARLASALESSISDRFGIWSSVVVRSRDELARILDGNPYPDEPNPKFVHVVFMNAEPPAEVLDRIKAAESEAAAKGSRGTGHRAGRETLFLHTPDGFGTSELAQAVFEDHQPAGEAAPARAGRHGQELGHRHQAALPVRGEMTPRRAVLVTGASRRIGRAVAQAFARQGDRVAVHHRDSEALAREVLAGLPGDGHTVVARRPGRCRSRPADGRGGRGQPGRPRRPW